MAQQPAAPAVPTLDRSAFRQVLRVPAVRVPARACSELMRKLRGFTLDLPRTKSVVNDGDRPDARLLLLKQDTDPQALSPEVQEVMAQHEGCELVLHELQLDYSHFPADAVLKRLLPEGVEVPSSFESVGHVAHLNLRAEQLPYRNVIGQVLVDKNPKIRTVVNKVASIENEFRVFPMEVIAGEPDFETEVNQHGARFRLDFSQVYWNSRLETEHHRLVREHFRRGEVVVDVMAGIGPFAVPAALQGCRVYANDLNPASAKYLALNVQLNRVGASVQPFNMDGRAFVRLLLAAPGAAPPEQPAGGAAGEAPGRHGEPREQQQEQQQQQHQHQHQHQDEEQLREQQQQQQQPSGASKQQEKQQQQQEQQQKRKQQQRRGKLVAEVPPPAPPGFAPPPGGLLFHHAVMNLPASAVEFLDAFHGAFDPEAWRGHDLPLVHVYTFRKNETDEDVVARVEAALGGALEAPPLIHVVRDVSPNKVMLCLSFRVPAAVAFAGRGGAAGAAGEGSPAAKKPRT